MKAQAKIGSILSLKGIQNFQFLNRRVHPLAEQWGLMKSKFFDLIDVVFKKYTYSTNRVFNADETGLPVVQSKI